MIVGQVTLKPTIESPQPRTYNIHVMEGEAYVETPTGLQVYQTLCDSLLTAESRDAAPLIRATDELLLAYHSSR